MKSGFNKLVSGIFIEDRLDAGDMKKLLRNQDARCVTLTRIKAVNLDFLCSFKKLEELKIYGGKIGDYSAIASLKKLKLLLLNASGSKTVTDLDFVSKLSALEELYLINVPGLRVFPNLARCRKLGRLTLWTCRQLSDISAVAGISKLQHLKTTKLPCLKPADFEFLMTKSGLVEMWCSFDTQKLNAQFSTLWQEYHPQPATQIT